MKSIFACAKCTHDPLAKTSLPGAYAEISCTGCETFILEIDVGGGLNCAKVDNDDLFFADINRPQR